MSLKSFFKKFICGKDDKGREKKFLTNVSDGFTEAECDLYHINIYSDEDDVIFQFDTLLPKGSEDHKLRIDYMGWVELSFSVGNTLYTVWNMFHDWRVPIDHCFIRPDQIVDLEFVD